MLEFLNPESDFMERLNRLTDLMILNLLFLFTSLPLVTLGASLSALYTVALDLSKKEEGPMFRSYFRAFRRHWRRGTGIVLPLFLLGLFLGISTSITFLLALPLREVLLMVQGSLLLFHLLWTVFSFGLLAKEEGGVRETLTASSEVPFRYFPEAMRVAAYHLLPVIATALLVPLFPQVFLFWGLIGTALVAYGSSFQIHRVSEKRGGRAEGPGRP